MLFEVDMYNRTRWGLQICFHAEISLLGTDTRCYWSPAPGWRIWNRGACSHLEDARSRIRLSDIGVSIGEIDRGGGGL